MTAAVGAGEPSPEDAHDVPAEDEVRALIALAALGGPDRLAHSERLALGRALETSPALRAELRALAAVAAALPPPGPRATPGPGRGLVPDALRRPEIVGALALLVLLLGLLRVAADPATDGASVATTTVATVSGTTELTPQPWGVELAIELDGTVPGGVYDVAVTDAAGTSSDVGGFLGDEGTVRFVATTGVAREDLRHVHVTDERGEVVLRADLD